MARVNRESLLSELESVQPGLSPREIVEQSSCFAFEAGYVWTYNDEVACRRKCTLAKEITGAVKAEPLLAILRKLPEDEVSITTTEGELLIAGKGRKAGVRMETEIVLPTKNVEKPKGWQQLPEDFAEAVSLVQSCAGRDESKFSLTCIHLTGKHLEACDNIQLARYRIKLPIEQDTLVRRDALKHIIALGMTEVAETSTWIHFRNGTGMILSCRRYVEEFPEFATFLKVSGTPVALPKGLADAVGRAEEFSKFNPDENEVEVELIPGKLRVRGQGAAGWYVERKSCQYEGPATKFLIAPTLLAELAKNHHECEIAPERLKVSVGKFTYVTCLGEAGDKSKDETPAEES